MAATWLSFELYRQLGPSCPHEIMADPYEDLQPYYTEDDFDDKYADELEVLREMDDPAAPDVPPRCRARLQFSPPLPPNRDDKAVREPELKESPLPAKSTLLPDATSKGEPVVCVYSGARKGSWSREECVDGIYAVWRVADMLSRFFFLRRQRGGKTA